MLSLLTPWSPGSSPSDGGASYFFIRGSSAGPQSPGTLSQGAIHWAALERERPPWPPAPACPPGVRGAGHGAGSLNPTARSEPTFRPPGPRAALGARQPAFVPWSQAALRAQLVSQAKPGRQELHSRGTDTDHLSRPALRSAQPLSQTLWTSWCAGPGPAALRADQDSAPPARLPAWGPQLGHCRESQGSPRGPLNCSRHSGLRGSQVLGALCSATCPPLLSSRSLLGPGQGAGSEPFSLIRTAPV